MARARRTGQKRRVLYVGAPQPRAARSSQCEQARSHVLIRPGTAPATLPINFAPPPGRLAFPGHSTHF
jgi:hypothetical protein